MRNHLCFLAAMLLCTIGAKPAAATPLAAPPSADATHWIQGYDELTEPWRFHSGDNPAWAAPDFDDSHWQLLRTDESWSQQGYPDYDGYGWYRLRIRVPRDQGELAIAFPSLFTCAEIYADGQLIGTIGRMRPRPIAEFTPVFTEVFRLPPPRRDGITEVAVRVWEWSHFRKWAPGGITAHPRVGSPAILQAQSELDHANRAIATIPVIILDAFSLAIGLFSLGLFLLRLQARVYGWAALWLVWSALTGLLYTRTMLVQGSFNTLNALLLLTFPAAIAYLLFVWSFVGARAGLGLHIALGLTTLEYLAQIMLLRDIITPASSNLANSILTLLIALLVFALLLRSAARGNRDAALLLVPFLLASLGQAGEGLRSVFYELGWIPVTREFNIYAGHGFAVTYAQFATLLSYLAIGAALVVRFTRSAREQQRMASELDSARQVQAQLVPASLPTLPHLHIEAAYRAAAEVGGDFYQVVAQACGTALIVLGDVSGKGLKAAMTGALAIGALRALAVDEAGPAKLLARLNRLVCAAQNGGFITCLCLRISRDGQVVLANAGHLAPYRSGEEIPLLPGLPLGIAADAEYCETTLQLAPGDALTLLSDGVVEARTKDGELFGFERTRVVSAESAESIARAAQNFGQEDDITVLTLTFAPAEVLHA